MSSGMWGTGRVVFGSKSEKWEPPVYPASVTWTTPMSAVDQSKRLAALEAENAELRRQIAELIGRLAAMEAR